MRPSIPSRRSVTRRTTITTLALAALPLGCAIAPGDGIDQGTEGVAASVTRTFEDGVAPTTGYAGTRDTVLRQAAPTTNYGTTSTLIIDGDEPDGTGTHSLSLVRWDLSSIPAGSTIQSAAITLSVSNPTGDPYYAYALSRDWNEAQATWNQAATGQAWQTGGASGAADRSATALAALSARATGAYTVALNAAGVAQVQSWVDTPSRNFGLALDHQTSADGLRVDSREGTTHPSLAITYTPPSGTGTGLRGEYYRDATFGSLALTRTDPTVDFDWAAGSPASAIPVDHFSVRWTGSIVPRYTETYTFTTTSDDGVRLWINGVELVNNWTDHGSTSNSGTVALTAGTHYDVRLEYYENGGSAVAKLAWSSAHQSAEIVPQSQLSPPGSTGGDAGTDAGHDAATDAGHDAGTDAGHDAGAPDTGVPTSGNDLGLDESGRTIPDTAFAIPSNAIFMSPTGNDANAGTLAAPVRTINRAVALVASGGTIVARGGTYRDLYNNGAGGYHINTKLFTLQAYPHEQPWFDGADVVPTASWHADGSGHWYVDWSTPSFCDGHYYDHAPNAQSSDNVGPCTHWDMYSTQYPVAGDPQNAFVDGTRQTQVGTLAAVGAGSFFYDWNAHRLYIGTNPSGHTLELSARANFMVSGVSAGGMVFRGLGFRRFATNEYSNLTSGALYIGGGGGNVVQDCAFTQMSGQAFSGNPQTERIVHNVFAFNGFNGVGGNGHSASGAADGLLVQDNLFNQQNLEHYGTNCSLSCASAHIKIAHMDGWTVRHNVFENGDPVTVGIWCDTDCHDGITVNNYLSGGANASGIHYEINQGGIIASNVIVGFDYGINIGSQDVRVYNNTLIDQRTISLRVYDDSRPLVTTNVSLVNNVSWGTNVNKMWFAKSGGTNGPGTFITGLDYNAWFRPSSFVLYRWIDATDTHFNSTVDFRAAHGAFEGHSVDVVGGSDPFFVDEAGGDYHVRSGSAAYRSGTAIPADIAAAIGSSTSAGQDRGALSWPSP